MIHYQSSLVPNANQPFVVQQQFYQPPDSHHSSVVHHQSYQAPATHQQSQASFPTMDSGLAVPSFLPSDDLIATIYDRRVTMQMVKGRQTQRYACSGVRRSATGSSVNRNGGTYTSAWFKEKAMLAEALKSCIILDEEQMALLADNGDIVTTGQESQEIPTPTIFQTNHLDAFDSNCDEASSVSAVLMAKLSSYDLDVLLEVPTHDTYLDNQVIDQSVQEMHYSEQPFFNNDTDIDITSDSNIVSYEQYLKETENAVIQDTFSSTQQDALMSMIEEMSNQVAKCNEVDKKFDLNDREKYIDSQLREVIIDRNEKVADFQNQIHSLKLQLSATVEKKKKKALDNVVYKMGQSMQTMHMLTKPQAYYDESHKTTLGYQNLLYLTQAQRKVPTSYCGRTIVKQHDELFIIDIEETLELAEESRLRMHAKQNDSIAKDKKVNIAPIDYAALNKLSGHFVKHFNAFEKDVILFVKTLKEYFHMFDQGLHKEITDMKEVFTQMETKVAKCSKDRKYFEIEKKELIIENDHLLEHISCQDVMSIVMHANVESTNVFPANIYSLEYDNLEAELLKKENDRLLELIISQDILHTAINYLATIVDYQRVISSASTSGSKPLGNTKKNRISRPTSSNKKNKVEDHLRSIKSSFNKKNRVSKPVYNANVMHSVINANSELVYSTCNECMFDAIHDLYVVNYLNNVNEHAKSRSAKSKKKKNSKPTGHPNRTIRFKNDHVAAIMGYGDYQIGNVTISRVYYVEGLGHNLFLVRQFCDSDLEVAFRKQTCYVRDLEGVDLLKGSRGTNLYTLSLEDMMQSSLICLLSKASKTKSWLWHRWLSHLNFGYINELAKQGLVRGLSKLKYQKDHLRSARSLGKKKKHTHKPKSQDFIQEKLYMLHMHLCGPIRIESINGKIYILVIVDDHSQFTWVKFLRS
ncbi:retrovirus-related pol polyprotein from transposon TNT 1-94 [Tanacetum coccineum]